MKVINKHFKRTYWAVCNRLNSSTSTLHQVSLVAGGTVVAQILNVITMPVLSRIYSPSDFGIMAVYSAVIAILTELVGLRYYLAIPLPKSPKYADALMYLCFILQIIIVALTTLVLYLGGDYIFRKMSIHSLAEYKYMIPIGLLAIGTYNMFTQCAIRSAYFKTIGITKVTQALTGAFVKIAFGLFGIKPLGLIIGTIFGQAGGIIALFQKIFFNGKISEYSKTNVIRVLLRYRKFPIYGVPFGILNTFGVNLPQLFLAINCGAQVAGYYTMANFLLSIPSVFIGQAIGQVFLQKASNAAHKGKLQTVALLAYKLLIKIGCFPIILISITAPYIFSIFLGDLWIDAGKYATSLAPWIATAFVFSPLSMLYSVQERQKIAFITELLYFIGRLCALLLGLMISGPLSAIILFSLVGTLMLGYRIADIFFSLDISRFEIAKYAFSTIMFSLILILVPYIFITMNVNVLLILASCLVASAVYLYDVHITLKQIKII